MNNEHLQYEEKVAILEMQNTLISCIADVENAKIKGDLIMHNKIQVSWHNVYGYYSLFLESLDKANIFDQIDTYNCLDFVMIDYLNKSEVYTTLSKNMYSLENKELFRSSDLMKAIIKCDDLTFESYTSLLMPILTEDKMDLPIFNLGYDKQSWLIKNGFIEFSVHHFNELKEQDIKLAIQLIIQNQNELDRIMEELEIEEEDFSMLFSSNDLSETNKYKLIKFAPSEVIRKDYSMSVVKRLISRCLQPLEVDYDIFEVVLNELDDLDLKIKAIVQQEELLDDNKLTHFVKGLGNDYLIFLSGKRPKFADTESNKQLFDLLMKRGISKRKPTWQKKPITTIKLDQNE